MAPQHSVLSTNFAAAPARLRDALGQRSPVKHPQINSEESNHERSLLISRLLYHPRFLPIKTLMPAP
jgi:hypothetical protein